MSSAIKRCEKCGAACVYTDLFCVVCGAPFEMPEKQEIYAPLPKEAGGQNAPAQPGAGEERRVPAHERHKAHVEYGKKKRPKRSMGRAFLLVVAAVMVIGGFYAISRQNESRAQQTGAQAAAAGEPVKLEGFLQPVQQQPELPAGFMPIRTRQDLVAINKDLTGKYILMNDIDLGGDQGKWTPIGMEVERYYSSLTEIGGFTGVFDGNGYTISGLSVAMPALQPPQVFSAGLFAMVLDGTVKNLAVEGEISFPGSRGEYTYAGGIAGIQVGEWQESSIQNCTFTGRVEGAYYCGGIAGLQVAREQGSRAAMTHCSSGGVVFGRMAGGIVGCQTASGAHAEAYVAQCGNQGPVYVPSGASNEGGGIVGLMQATGAGSRARVEQCYNLAEIHGVDHTGGIAGAAVAVAKGPGGTQVEINACYNTMPVNGKRRAGGIAGYCYAETAEDAVFIQGCLSLGKVEGGRRNTQGAIVPAGKEEQEKSFVVEECYYTKGVGSKDAAATRISAEEMAERLAALQAQIAKGMEG